MRILLVEDDAVLGAAVHDQITSDGHSADRVARLDAAADNLRAAPYDLVLLDLMLPDGHGIPLLRSSRARGTACPGIDAADDDRRTGTWFQAVANPPGFNGSTPATTCIWPDQFSRIAAPIPPSAGTLPAARAIAQCNSPPSPPQHQPAARPQRCAGSRRFAASQHQPARRGDRVLQHKRRPRSPPSCPTFMSSAAAFPAR